MFRKSQYGWAYAAFAAGLAVVIAILMSDMRPAPLYRSLIAEPAIPQAPGFHAEQRMGIEFDAPKEDLQRVHWFGMLYHELQEMEFRVENVTQKRCLVERTVRGEDDWRWQGDNEIGDRLRIELLWLRDSAPAFPESITLADKKNPESSAHTVELGDWPTEWLPEQGFRQSFEAPSEGLTLLELPSMTTDYKTRVKVELFNVTTGKSLKKTTITGAEAEEGPITFKEGNAQGDELELRLYWQRVPPPALHGSGADLLLPIEVRVNNQLTDFRPLLGLEYEWSTRRLLWLWPPVLIFCGVLLIRMARTSNDSVRRRLSMTVLVVAALMASIASCLSWQQSVATESAHLDPDGFGRYARQMVDWLQVDSGRSRDEVEATWDTWRYSWLPLTPVLIAVQLLCGVALHPAYLMVVGLAGFGVVVLFHWMLRRHFGLSEVAATGGALLLLTHHFFLKSFAKPSTDPLGMLLVMAGLVLVCERLRTPVSGKDSGKGAVVALSVVMFLHFEARPPGFLFAGFFLFAALLADVWRQRRLIPRKAVVEGIRLGIWPFLLAGVMFFGFDWADNFQAALNSNESHHDVSTVRRFGIMMVSMLQLLPLFWFGIKRGERRRPEFWLLVLWAAFYLLLIVGVGAGFVTRLFLPMLPVPILLAVIGLHHWAERGGWRKGLAIGLAVFTVLVNIAVVTYHTSLSSLPPQSVAEWIYH